jgi:phosphate uptake regulator
MHSESVTENLRFMIHEVGAQVEQTLQFFAEPSRTMVEKIRSRDDYVDTLKSVIQEKTYDLLISTGRMEKNRINFLRSVNTIATNLERIADFSVNMLRQAEHLTQIDFMTEYELDALFEEILAGVDSVEKALLSRDIALAFRICQCEFRLDSLYENRFKQILSDLQNHGHAGNLVTALMILHYLERMGDSLLNIGEAIIFSLVGEKLKIQQYAALTESLNASGMDTPISEVEFESIWGTRSGCRIGRVGDKEPEKSARPVLFKHGNLKKIVKEKYNIEAWDLLVPGLAPAVCGFVEGRDNEGSILLEYLPGCTFQELVLTGNEAGMRDALFIIEETTGYVWETTMKEGKVVAGFVQQILNRLEVVYRLHPQLLSKPAQINGLQVLSFGELLRAVEKCEADLFCPFSVFTHGDFNVNNIIYDFGQERIHYIDLHRSAQTDYVQDVSVFLVSLFRLPVFDKPIRGRLNFAIMDFFEFAKKFAEDNRDQTFEARLALGLARSFFTSTRFELNHRFSRKMYNLSVYLMEKLLSHQGRPWESFELPGETLVYA